jgi:hypothetical protein
VNDDDPALRIRLLGGFEVIVRGSPVPGEVWRLRRAKTVVKARWPGGGGRCGAGPVDHPLPRRLAQPGVIRARAVGRGHRLGERPSRAGRLAALPAPLAPAQVQPCPRPAPNRRASLAVPTRRAPIDDGKVGQGRTVATNSPRAARLSTGCPASGRTVAKIARIWPSIRGTYSQSGRGQVAMSTKRE